MGDGPQSNMDVKRMNRRRVLEKILDKRSISNRELAEELGLTFPTVVQFIKDFQRESIVVETGVCESTGGRKAKLYSPNLNKWFTIGLDITQHHVAVTVVNIVGEVRDYKRLPLVYERTDTYFQEVGRIVREEVEAYIPEGAEVIGVGISVPGIVNAEGDCMFYSHILNEKNLQVESFGRYIPYPCQMINDANAGAMSELHRNREIKDLIYFSLSNSVGGAVFVGGNKFWPEHIRSGEVGHMTVVPGGQKCYCGKRGCLDAYCAAHVLSEKTGGNLTEFFRQVRSGNQELNVVWSEYLDMLAIAINNIRMLFDCDVMVGGYVGPFLNEDLGELRRRVAARSTFETDGGYIRPSVNGLSAAAQGAALQYIWKIVQDA